MERTRAWQLAVTICILIAALSGIASAQYGGGAGEPNDPYLIIYARASYQSLSQVLPLGSAFQANG